MTVQTRRSRQRLIGGLAVVAAFSILSIGCVANSGPAGPTTTTSTTLPWSPPTGQWFGFSLTCNFYVLGQYYSFPEYPTVNIEAPAQVEEGETFDITFAPGTFEVPTSVQGFSLSSLKWMTIRYPLPENVEFVDSLMTAGIDNGPGYPSLKIEGDFMVYRVPGPFAPGATVQMPKVHITFTATGVPGSFVETRMKSLTNVAQFAAGSVSSTCNSDDPDRVFTSTEIVAAP